jgi:hypothetical protein
VKLDVRIPAGAEERAWKVVRSAFEERELSPHRRRPWRPVAVLAAAAVVAGIVASPPGQAVLDSIREAVGVKRAEPALFSLPTPGRLLVQSRQGVWVVQADGSKRLLRGYREASWSPLGRFVVAARRNELAALEPDGDVRWSLARRDVHFPRWAGTDVDTRIAYLSGSDLHVVAGDGTGDRVVARHVAPVAPAWQPRAGFVVAFADRKRRIRAVDADTGRRLEGDWRLDRSRTLVRRRGQASEALLDGRVVFRGTGEFFDSALSPDGRWLLVTWPTADQWVFVRVSGKRKIAAVSGITAQFGGGAFPRIAGWCCPYAV